MVHGLAVLAAVHGSHAEAVALARGDGCVAVHKLISKVICSTNLTWILVLELIVLRCNQGCPPLFSCMLYRSYLVVQSGHKPSPSVLQGRSSAASRSKARHAKVKAGGQTQQWQELCLLGPDHGGHSAAVNSV